MPTPETLGNLGLRAPWWIACLVVIGALVWAPPAAVADGPPAGVSNQEWAGIQQQIEAERHKVTESDRPGKLYRADNPAQRFTAHFGAEDVVIEPSGRGEPAWHLGLRLTAWGSAKNLQPVHPATAFSESNRIEYRRGPLTEWYVNTTLGLDQGFTIEAPPADGIEELVLEMTLDGDVTPALFESGNAISFRQEGSESTLTYSGLAAWDAVNAPLEGRIELQTGGSRLRLVVAVTNAAWPITVDPIFTQVTELLPTPELDSHHANFGRSVAVDGDFMAVGVDDLVHGENSGLVHIFQHHQGGIDTWDHVAQLSSLDGAAFDDFGFSVAIDGDTALVGAPFDEDTAPNSGSAYAYQRDQGGSNAWGQVAKITPSDGETGDYFGYRVSISGDIAVIGAWGNDHFGVDSGAAYLFQRDEGGPDAWGQSLKIKSTNGAAWDDFGASVAINSDIVAIGAPGHDGGFLDSGSVEIFESVTGPSGHTVWIPCPPVLVAERESFGFSVSMDGTTAIVGAPQDDDNGSNSGSATVFLRDEGGTSAWGQAAKITCSDCSDAELFGTSVSVSGSTALVGAPDSDGLGVDSGAAYVFFIGYPFFADDFESGDTSIWSETVP